MRIHDDLPMNRKILGFYDIILQNDVACPNDVVCTDTSGLYDYPFNFEQSGVQTLAEEL